MSTDAGTGPDNAAAGAHGGGRESPADAQTANTDDRRHYADLLTRLDETLEEAGIFVASDVRDGVLFLAGEVDSTENRDAALDVATTLAEPVGLRVDDAIDVLPTAPDDAFVASSSQFGSAYGWQDPDADKNLELDPTFPDEPDFAGDVGTTDSQVAVGEGVPWFPPTDPVVEPVATNEELRVVGGFTATSMDDEDQTYGPERNDDDITQAVMRELREDASTYGLPIQVDTINGVVSLRGQVPALDDAENAEAVASRVPGVREVREQLIVGELRNEGDRR